MAAIRRISRRVVLDCDAVDVRADPAIELEFLVEPIFALIDLAFVLLIAPDGAIPDWAFNLTVSHDVGKEHDSEVVIDAGAQRQ